MKNRSSFRNHGRAPSIAMMAGFNPARMFSSPGFRTMSSLGVPRIRPVSHLSVVPKLPTSAALLTSPLIIPALPEPLRRNNKSIIAPAKEALEALRLQGKTRTEMALHYDVSLATMKRWIGLMDVGRRMSDRRKAEQERAVRAKDKTDQCPLPMDDGISLMEMCRSVLGQRMGEDHRGYTLDGRPASSNQVVDAAEKIAGVLRKAK